MSLVTMIYLIGMLEPLQNVSGFLICSGTLSIFVSLMFKDEIPKKTCTKIIKSFVIVITISVMVSVTAPTKETAYIMLAAYGVEEAVIQASQSEDVKRISSKSLQLLENTLDKYIENSESIIEEKVDSSN